MIGDSGSTGSCELGTSLDPAFWAGSCRLGVWSV